MVCRIVNQIGTSCSRRNVSRAGSPWRPATGGSRRSTITTTVTASTARCAKRTSKDRASSLRVDDPSARHTPAKCNHVIYNSDTVYSTTTFRPVSPSPRTPPATGADSPQRTRKLETPLHFDGGLFSDIRSTEGKLLSKVTVDRVHCSTRRDVTDSPSVYESVDTQGSKEYVDDILKTETITNEEVIKVKFTPVPLEFNGSPRLLTPSQFQIERPQTPVPYIDGFEDLQSYKIVNSICKEKLLESSTSKNITEGFDRLELKEPVGRSPSPLANFLVSEQLTKIDHYLQESLDACSGSEGESGGMPSHAPALRVEGETIREAKDTKTVQRDENKSTSTTIYSKEGYQKHEVSSDFNTSPSAPKVLKVEEVRSKHKVNSVKEKVPGILRIIYNMPIHYHAIILCFFLIVYNLIYQYVKENCHGKK